MREKEPSSFNYQGLLWRIVGGARRKAETIPTFRDSRNGCIRICLIPLCRNADNWLGELSCYTYPPGVGVVVDRCEREFVFNIDPSGSHVIQWQDPNIVNHVEPVSCYAYSALKMAYAKWKHQLRLQLSRGEIAQEAYDQQFREQTKYFTEENGWSRHKGAVGMTVQLRDEDFMQVFVCVSGADSRDDHACALEGMLEAQEFFLHYAYAHSFEVTMLPRIDGMKSPLEQTWEQPEADDA